MEPALPGDDELMKSIHGHWDRRRKIARVVKYDASGEVVSVKGYFSDNFRDALRDASGFPSDLKGHLPSSDTVHPSKFTLLMDFTNGKVRNAKEEHAMHFGIPNQEAGFRPHVATWIFDGKATKMLTFSEKLGPASDPSMRQRGENWELLVQTPDLANGTLISSQELPILLGHGYVPTEPDVILTTFPEPQRIDCWSILGQGVIGEVRCVILCTRSASGKPTSWEYWVDVARGGAVLRAIRKCKGQMDSSVDIDYESAGEGSLPKAWVSRQYFRKNSALMKTFRYSVKARVLDPSQKDKDYDIDLLPGMLIDDEVGQLRGYSRVGEDGYTLKPSPPPFC